MIQFCTYFKKLAINQIYKRNNLIEATKMGSSIEYELFNGFYLGRIRWMHLSSRW
jgi:hypothetical protein